MMQCRADTELRCDFLRILLLRLIRMACAELLDSKRRPIRTPLHQSHGPARTSTKHLAELAVL